ncbi:hypothetical protein [Desulfosporosinus sp.]|nr:hypothetical protein [Desulfosporosinus sp.]
MRYRFIGRILQEQWPNMIGTVAGCHRIAGRMPQEYSGKLKYQFQTKGAK